MYLKKINLSVLDIIACSWQRITRVTALQMNRFIALLPFVRLELKKSVSCAFRACGLKQTYLQLTLRNIT